MSTISNLVTKNKGFIQKKNFLKSKDLFLKPITKPVIKLRPINFIQGIIHAKCTLNNTIITLTDLLGNTKAWVSCGSMGFKGSKRSSRFAGQSVSEQLGIKAKTLGYTKVILHLNGLGKGRNVCVKGFKKSGLKIYFIKDSTSVPYNGCRPSKLRRL